MDQTPENQPAKVKQRYSFIHYIIIAIIGLLGYFAPKFFDKSKDKKLAIIIGDSKNQITPNEKIKSAISVKYSLNGDTSEVKSYYSTLITLTNVSDVGIDNIVCKVEPENENIYLSPNPLAVKNDNNIEYSVELPSKIPDSLSRKVITPLGVIGFNEYRGYTINIPLMNKNESLSFLCEGYSRNVYEKNELNVVVRQKDLEVIYKLETEDSAYLNILSYFSGIGAAITGMVLLHVISFWTEIRGKKTIVKRREVGPRK